MEQIKRVLSLIGGTIVTIFSAMFLSALIVVIAIVAVVGSIIIAIFSGTKVTDEFSDTLDYLAKIITFLVRSEDES